jgi:Chaperone of endosialidase
MGLSRLDNFLKSTRGTILYVDPNSLDATDSIENQGNSLTRPFRTLQRALIEASRFSYQRGLDNDRFNKTTILLYPGDHLVDNRPGWIPDGASNFRLRSGATSSALTEWTLNSNFDVTTSDNELYKLNSIYGGVIVPRGTSIVGMDLRKTKIRPLYVPNPLNDNIERSAIFRITGACYFWQFSVFDADPNGLCYKDYTTNQFVPNFSHHKLSVFEYADGVNNVKINDTFQQWETARTDLTMYYEKVGIAYGQSSGRPIDPDYPSTEDIQPVIDEYRIVGSRGASVGITSIKSGNGVTGTNTITVTLASSFSELGVDSPIQIDGVSATGYDGQYVVSAINSSTEIQYQVQNIPTVVLPSAAGASLSIAVDTVTSASPYIFNCSVRSVYGMCGLLADGNKAAGFKSMVVAQYTGIGLQKDDNAFVKYDSTTGTYKDTIQIANLHSDSLARFKPTYENFHIRATNNAYLQLVSVFAIGYAEHFSVESGGDFSINNSNSNFGAKSLSASGFRRDAFTRDDVGYITHFIGPKEIDNTQIKLTFDSIDVATTVGVASTSRLYLYQETDLNNPPQNVIDGYRVGAKSSDSLYVNLSNSSGVTTTYSARIIMPTGTGSTAQTTSEKIFKVGNLAGINSITTNIVTLTQQHSFINGETIRVIAEDGHLPDGLLSNQVYYAITSTASVGLGADQIKVAQTYNDAVNNNPVIINNKGGVLKIISRVSDKNSGDIGHPIQYDSTQSQWYVNVATAASENSIYPVIQSSGVIGLGNATPRTYFSRKVDSRVAADTTYRVRFVIPKDSPTLARPPLEGFVLQESNNIVGGGNTEIGYYFSPTATSLTNPTQLRNPRFIAGANWNGTVANIVTELPHDLTVGAQVEIININSTNNPTGIGSSAYNGTYTVTGISSTKQFSFPLSVDPGTFTNDTSARTTSLPYFKRKKLANTYQIYRTVEAQKYIQNVQDGVYHLTLVNSGNSPTVDPFTNLKLSQPLQYLYPQTNKDNPYSDPYSSVCFALPDPIGQVVVNDLQRSLTKETTEKNLFDFNVGIGITNIVSSGAGTTHTIYTSTDHGLCGITSVSITNAGAGYSVGTFYNARLVGTSATTGVNATARVTVSAGGTLTNVTIMDGGSAYVVGNTLSVVGIPTAAGFSAGTVTVANIYNNVGDCISVAGVRSDSYLGYNTLYKIVGVSTYNQISVQSSKTLTQIETAAGVGVTLTANAQAVVTGTTLGISTFTFDAPSGIGTLSFTSSHGFRVNNKLRIGGADQSTFNGDFIVKSVNSSTSVAVNIGIATTAVSTGGVITVYRPLLSSSGGDFTTANENVSGRLIYAYAGITTTLGVNFLSTGSETDPIVIPNADILGLKLGDYLLIDDEILRIKNTVSGSTVYAYRALFGTLRANHTSGTTVKRIKPQPVELRRNSIIRASGHTFEYLGYGPGNYSTAFPEKQDRVLSPEETLLAQALRTEGGVTNYTGMDDKGDFYTGNRKINSSIGKEEVYDTPIQTTVGEDLENTSVNVGHSVVSASEVFVDRSIKISGGENNNLISMFDGPVVFDNKVSSTSSDGIEALSLFVQGDADISRKFTVSAGSTPTSSGTPGDVITKAFPQHNQYLGWIYTLNNYWEPFGYIGTLPSGLVFGSANQILYKNSIGDFSGNNDLLFQDNSTVIIGIGASTNVQNQKVQVGGGAYISGFVGIGSTMPSSKLTVTGDAIITGIVTVGTGSVNINGNTNVINAGITSIKSGVITATSGIVTYYGDAQYLLNIDNSKWSNVASGVGTGIYSKSLLSVGIGTTNPQSALHVVTGVSTNVDGGLARFLAPNLGIGSVTSVALGRTFSSGNNFQSVLFGYNYYGSSASSGSYLAISHAGQGNTLVIADTDRVGVGTASPQAKLHVVGDGIFTGDITAFYTSDQRLKDNITPIPNALDKVTAISGNTFDWNEKSGKEGTEVGVIAQEILEVLPEAVTTRDNGYLAVRYEKLVPLLIEAIKELKEEINELKGGK